MHPFKEIDGVINLESNVAQARDEIAVEVDPAAAGAIGLTTQQVGLQLSQFLAGRAVTTVNINGQETDVVLSGGRAVAGGLESVGSLIIDGPAGSAPLSELASLTLREGPVNISRTDGERSASITGAITEEDTQAVGVEIDRIIDELELPYGVTVTSGGIFADIAEGFQAIFLSMVVGIILMYLVMVASLGSLRNPFIIITSLPWRSLAYWCPLPLRGVPWVSLR